QAAEEILYQMAPFVEVTVVVARAERVGLRGDHGLDARLLQKVHDAFLGVVGLVGDHRVHSLQQTGQEDVGTVEVVRLARREVKGSGGAHGVARLVDVGGWRALALADEVSLGVSFFCAPPRGGGRGQWWRRSWRSRCRYRSTGR